MGCGDVCLLNLHAHLCAEAERRAGLVKLTTPDELLERTVAYFAKRPEVVSEWGSGACFPLGRLTRIPTSISR